MEHFSINLSPSEMNNRSYEIGVKKTSNNPRTTRLLAFMAGAFIALAAIINARVNAVLSPSIAPFLGAFMFNMGLMLVIIAGGELFTGNILLFGGFLDKRYGVKPLLTNWVRVYFWNLLGGFFIAAVNHYLVAPDPDVAQILTSSIQSKVALSFVECLGMGFMCNILVCLGVWVSFSANDGISKFALMGVPIIAFILLKYEHSVANMFYFSFGVLESTCPLTFAQILKNMIPVTIGNILGGMFIASVYHFAFKKNK